MFVAAKTREGTPSVTREHKFLREHWPDLCVEKLWRDSTHPVREKRVNKRGKREATSDSSCAPRPDSSSAVSFPRSNERPGTHCSLIVEKRKYSSCQICQSVRKKNRGEVSIARAEREREPERWREKKWQSCWCCWHPKSLKNGTGFSRKAGTQRACRIEKGGLHTTKWAIGKDTVAFFAERRRTKLSVQITRWWRDKDLKEGKSHPSRKRDGSEREHGVGRVSSRLKESGFLWKTRASKESPSRK